MNGVGDMQLLVVDVRKDGWIARSHQHLTGESSGISTDPASTVTNSILGAIGWASAAQPRPTSPTIDHLESAPA